MLDLGLSKLAIIGVVALVVIGPEKLPRVARTAGALLGRAQRYINDVKSEVSREMDMGDLKEAKSAFEDAARNVHSTVNDHVRETEDHLNDTWRTLSPDAESEAASALPEPETSALNPSGYSVYEDGVHTPSVSATGYSPSDAGKVRRRNWRIKQSTPPVWFKRTQGVRTRIQSGAARVARHRPADVDPKARLTRFL
jgi:sec-independent protein translocase protein TatB